ncbi:cation-translocating P-type ATPase [Methylocaldum gracile]|jgi:Ca2+-transporting ATPase|uniref:cation-translocating P-type ATPase n=1 Tax=Methylocaldum sp. 0917 TaxID=2485163 RepID=UPI00105E6794
MSWHSQPVDRILQELKTEAEGLSADEARRRLEEYGPNEIRKGREISPLRILLAQFNDFLIYLLLAAAILSVGVGFLPGSEPEYTEAILILVIVLANGLFGFVQDYRAERAMQSLRELSTPQARVLRDGTKITVPATELAPGDVIVIDQGNRIPADARMLESHSLETMEASLTGESATVPKEAEPVDEDTPLAQRSNMLFMNTDAVRGRGKAVVVATGMNTEVGAIASEIESAEQHKTPFQEEVDRLGKQIGYGILGLILVVAVIQYFATETGIVTIILVAVTLAVAAVPEGLPAVVTLALALGSQRLIKQNALVRRLSVVESLGSVDVIVTDKTGTLTENQMTVKRLYFAGRTYEVTGEGTKPDGEFRRNGESVPAETLEPLLKCGAVVNDAEKTGDAADYSGDPTEVALLVSAAKAGIEAKAERLREIPFSSERKRMTVIAKEEPPIAYMKGAPEVVLDRCSSLWTDGEAKPLDEAARHAIVDKNKEFAGSAFRVLAFAQKEVRDTEGNEDEIESGMVFLGLQAMIDPPRAEVKEAVQDCRKAGVRVIMVTGDNLATAKAIGAQIGFSPEGAMTGTELDRLSEQDLARVAERAEVFARVSPHHKVVLLKALQESGHRVAMTGDGVNDAPALRNAHVGVAMGRRGTDVAKEASDMVLQDDNFVTLRNAIAEGRGIFDNIRKFVNFLLSANAGEILIVFLGVLAGAALFPRLFEGQSEALILTPVMLLWINLITDGLPALALSTDPKTEGIMKQPPRGSGEPVLDRRIVASILGIGLIMAATGLPLFFHGLWNTGDLARAQTQLFTFIVVAEMVRIQVIRARYALPILSNRWLVAAVASSLALQAIVLYTPANELFEVATLAPGDWQWIGIAFAAFLLLSVTAEKSLDRIFGIRVERGLKKAAAEKKIAPPEREERLMAFYILSKALLDAYTASFGKEAEEKPWGENKTSDKVEAFRLFSEAMLKAYARTFDHREGTEPQNARKPSKTD